MGDEKKLEDGTTVDTNNTGNNNQSSKTFTQEQVNEIVSKRVSELNKKIDTLTSDLSTEKENSEKYSKELTDLRNRDIAYKSGVPSKFVDFAVFEASKLVSDKKTFESAIKDVIDSNKELFNVQPTTNYRSGSSANTNDTRVKNNSNNIDEAVQKFLKDRHLK